MLVRHAETSAFELLVHLLTVLFYREPRDVLKCALEQAQVTAMVLVEPGFEEDPLAVELLAYLIPVHAHRIILKGHPKSIAGAKVSIVAF
jgi:hypothetical protein